MNLEEKCQRLASEVLADHGWTLVQSTEPEFLIELQNLVMKYEVAENELERVIRRKAISVYCVYLYEAYREDGSERQAQAMGETLRYIYPRLLFKANNNTVLAEEAAQFAVVQAWQHWKEVRDPYSFLGYVLSIGLRELLHIQRKAARDEPETPEMDGLADRLSTNDLESQVELNDTLRHIHQIVAKCLERPEEIRIVREHILAGKSYKTLAQEWQTKIGYLHLLKFRALKNLNNCDEFLRFRFEWTK